MSVMDSATYVCLATLFYALCPASKATVDPCIPGAHKELPRGKYRGTLCRYNNEKPVCDRQIEEGWYKVQGINGPLQMPEGYVGVSFCGTNFPIWLNGSHPTGQYDVAVRTGCMSSAASNCSVVVNITIKECSGFYVYYLTPTRSCSSAYCFGIDEVCPPFDPCDSEYEHKVLENANGDRSSMCTTVGTPYCDDKIEDGWYAIHSRNGYQVISSNCPGYSSCQTINPIWINDQNVECPIPTTNTTTTLDITANSTENGVPSKYDFVHFMLFPESIMLLVLYLFQRN